MEKEEAESLFSVRNMLIVFAVGVLVSRVMDLARNGVDYEGGE